MENRTAAIFITIGVILLFGCPGILLLCNGSLALIEILSNYQVQIIGYGYNAPYWAIGSYCAGFFFVIVVLLIALLVLRRKKGSPSKPDEPIPPTI